MFKLSGSKGRGVNHTVILPLPRSREGNESLNKPLSWNDRDGKAGK